MNCYLHPETAATAFCRTCGRSLCTLCQRPAEGTIYCQDHMPVPVYNAAGSSDAAANPYFEQAGKTAVAPVRTSPGLAFILGFIPGVGAIYNGQYLKGLVHALIFGLLVTITSNSPGPAEPLIGILLSAFVFYMPFEAYHTAKKREAGIEPDEWSSILPRNRYSGRAPIGPIVLIAIGVLYLLNTLELVNFRQIGRFWPVILIAVGAYMLYSRVSTPPVLPPGDRQPYPGARAGAAGNDVMGSRHE
jgi:Domain of unknown function (DUF5668)